jgi:hypothetical protein
MTSTGRLNGLELVQRIAPTGGIHKQADPEAR